MSQNGKGSAPRVRTAKERKRFESNYDDIFRKPGRVRVTKVEILPLPPAQQRVVAKIFKALARHRKKK